VKCGSVPAENIAAGLPDCRGNLAGLLGGGETLRRKHVGIEIAPKVFAFEPLHRSKVYSVAG